MNDDLERQLQLAYGRGLCVGISVGFVVWIVTVAWLEWVHSIPVAK